MLNLHVLFGGRPSCCELQQYTVIHNNMYSTSKTVFSRIFSSSDAKKRHDVQSTFMVVQADLWWVTKKVSILVVTGSRHVGPWCAKFSISSYPCGCSYLLVCRLRWQLSRAEHSLKYILRLCCVWLSLVSDPLLPTPAALHATVRSLSCCACVCRSVFESPHWAAPTGAAVLLRQTLP